MVSRLGVPALGRSLSPPTPLIPFCELPYCVAAGVGYEVSFVGKTKPALSFVGSAHRRLVRGVQVPLRIVPRLVKVTEDVSDANNDAWDVFQEDEVGSHFAYDAGDVRPQVPFVVRTKTLAGRRKGRTRESSSDEIHRSTPGSSVEAAKVSPDRTRVNDCLLHPTSKLFHDVGFPFRETHGSGYDASSRSWSSTLESFKREADTKFESAHA